MPKCQELMKPKHINFNQLDWYDPRTWFNAPSIPPPPFEGTSQDEKSAGLPLWKQNKTTNPVNLALTNEFVTPFKTAEKSVVSGVTNVWDEAATIGKTIEKDIKIIGTDIEDFSLAIEQDAVKVFKGAENAGIKIYNITRSSVIFVENNYKILLTGTAVYLGSRFYNEVKATKLI